MAKLTQFNGGMNAATAPHLIQENEGPFYENIDHVPGILKPLQDKLKDDTILGAERFGHFNTIDSMWYFSTTPKDYVEFQERLYIGDRHGTSTKVVDGAESNLGIIPPTSKPTLAATSYLLADLTDITLFALGTLFGAPPGDIPDDLDLEYRFVNENSTGELSEAEQIFEVKTGGLGPNAVYITIQDEAWTTEVHVYRKHLGLWKLMASVLFDPLLDFDKQPLILDTVYDISANTTLDEGTLSTVGQLTGKIQYAITYFSSATGIESVPVISKTVSVTNGKIQITNIEVSTDPQIDKKRIYRIGGNITTFSLVDTINNVITAYTDNIHDLEIPGDLLTSQTNFPPPFGMNWLLESYAMLFASDGDKLIFTPIGQPDSWPQTFFLDFPGFITGIGKTPIGLLVFTKFETFLVTGTGPLALSQQLLSGSQGCVAGDSVVNVQGATYWASTDGICISEGGKVIVYTRPKITKLDLSNTVNAVVFDQNYYILTEDRGISFILDVERDLIKTAQYDIRSYFIANDKLYGFNQSKLFEIEGGGAKLSITYVSPAMIGAGFTVQKVYKNIYMYSKGDIELEVYIDLELVQTVSFTEEDNHQIKVPSDKSRGFQIAFAIRGKGQVFEIRWDDGNANQ